MKPRKVLKWKFRNLISILLVVCGIGLLSYPTIRDSYINYQQDQLMLRWQESLLLIDSVQDDEEELIAGQPTKEELLASLSEKERQAELEKQEKIRKQQEQRQAYINKHMEGIIEIPSIKLKIPVLKGASVENLKISAASLAGSAKAGNVGNYVIAGHRMRAYGKIFNRLDDLTTGDEIRISDGTNDYVYTITEKFFVKPEETWVLNGNDTEREITLISCHPIYNPTHRIIIKGKIEE